jgi:signal transduction histidine kinase
MPEDDTAGLSDGLVERVKELNCIYSISSVLKGQQDLGDILQKVVNVLPSAWQHPDLACAALTLKGCTFVTKGYRNLVCSQRASVVVNGHETGVLEVGYVGCLPDGRPPQFLKEERFLLSMVAERIADLVALRDAQKQLSTYQEHLRSLASELTLAEERQRRTLALSLHDRIGQGLAVAKLKVETLEHVLPPEHQPRLRDVAALIKQIVNDTRSLTFEISPPILYELGLKQAVVWLSEHIQRQFGLPITVRCDEEFAGVSEGVRVMLFRSIQELLTNAVKHAHATDVTVLLLDDADELCVIVEDDGVGFDAQTLGRFPSHSGGFGLFSIRERIHHLGGRLDVSSSSGKGTRVQISVPRADATGVCP